jgi:peptidoglycan/LPS O-acetylase OafA/YrhL
MPDRMPPPIRVYVRARAVGTCQRCHQIVSYGVPDRFDDRPLSTKGMTTRLPERSLDVLRAFAVLCVLFDHTVEIVTGPLPWLSRIGLSGVLIFFVHTSLVLMASLERSGDGPLAFYVRRAFRIYPLAIVTVFAVVALRLPFGVHAGQAVVLPISTKSVVASATLTTNVVTGAVNVIGTLWSLPLEVQMYVLLPFCFLVALRGVRPTLVLYAAAVALYYVQAANEHLWRLSVLHYGPVFLFGVLAFAWLRERNGVQDLPPSALTRGAHVVAKYSYGIYLLHIPAAGIAFVWGGQWPTAAKWAVYAALLFVLPVAGYHAIEEPCIAWGKRLVHNPRRIAQLDPAP